jgi:hypothetical protein
VQEGGREAFCKGQALRRAEQILLWFGFHVLKAVYIFARPHNIPHHFSTQIIAIGPDANITRLTRTQIHNQKLLLKKGQKRKSKIATKQGNENP